MALKFKDVMAAFEFGDMGSDVESCSYLCRETGANYMKSDYHDFEEELPDDTDDKTKYIVMPDKRDLDLGKRLVLRFASENLEDEFDAVYDIFRKKGAYGRFKDLLIRTKKLEAWYAFEAKATEEALREWCEDNDIKLED